MRPLGVTLVGYYQIIRSVMGLVFGLFILFYRGPANKFDSVASQGNAVERLFRGFGHGAGLAVLLFVIIHLLAAYGILQVKNWGRFLTLAFSAIELAVLLRGAFQLNVFSLLFSALNAACLVYLVLPPIARSFQHAKVPSLKVG